MSKRLYIIETLQYFKNHADHLPDEVVSKLNHVLHHLENTTDTEMETVYDMVESRPASERGMEENHPLYLLEDLYSDLEKIAKSAPIENNQDELLRAVTQLQGYLDIKDRYFP